MSAPDLTVTESTVPRIGVRRFTVTLTEGELRLLHEQLGDLPKRHVGAHVQAFYRQLDSLVAILRPHRNGYLP